MQKRAEAVKRFPGRAVLRRLLGRDGIRDALDLVKIHGAVTQSKAECFIGTGSSPIAGKRSALAKVSLTSSSNGHC